MPIMLTGLIEKPIKAPPETAMVKRIQRAEDFVCLEGWAAR